MSIDMRRFDYALDPLLRLKEWQLEALRAQLGRLQQRISALQQDVASARDELKTQERHASESLLRCCDPALHVRSLQWLQQQRARIAALDAQVVGLQSTRSELVDRYRTQQQKLEAIEAHRDEAVVEFARTEAAGLAAAADRDWLARLPMNDACEGVSAAGGRAWP